MGRVGCSAVLEALFTHERAHRKHIRLRWEDEEGEKNRILHMESSDPPTTELVITPLSSVLSVNGLMTTCQLRFSELDPPTILL